jgi:hypothetical protein
MVSASTQRCCWLQDLKTQGFRLTLKPTYHYLSLFIIIYLFIYFFTCFLNQLIQRVINPQFHTFPIASSASRPEVAPRSRSRGSSWAVVSLLRCRRRAPSHPQPEESAG